MTLDEKKTKMAVRLGRLYHKPTEDEIKSGCYYQYEPKYDTDANTRKDILAVMTFEEEVKLIELLTVGSWAQEMLKILHLTQPYFFELAGQAMGLWEA